MLEIAKKYNVSDFTIRKFFRLNKIESKDSKSAQKHGELNWKFGTKGISLYGKENPNYKNGKPKCIDCGKELCYGNIRCKKCHYKNQIIKIDKLLIYDLYFKNKLTVEDISKKFKISHGAIANIFERNNWKTRKTKDYLQINISKSILYDLYINKKWSANKIAKKFKCSKLPILNLLKKFKISIRSRSESHFGINRGKKNPNWMGGFDRRDYPYEFNQALKHQIRQRDNFTCQCCGMTEEEHVKNFKQSLHVHHIDYNKKNYNNENLISLCCGCHTKSSFNRDYWYAFCKYIMDNKLYKEKI